MKNIQMRTTTKAALLLVLLTILLFAGLWLHVPRALYYYAGALVAGAILFRRQLRASFHRFLEKRHYYPDDLDEVDLSLKPRNGVQRLAILVHDSIQSIRAISLLAPTSLVLIFGVVVVGLVLYEPNLVTPGKILFEGAVLPSFFVFTLDGLLVIGLFGYFTSKRDKMEKERLRQVLRLFLFKYATRAAHALSLAEDVPALLRSQHAPMRVLNRFVRYAVCCPEAQRNDFAQAIKVQAAADIVQAAALIGISASLSPAHADLWFRAVTKLQQLAESSPSSWEHPMIDILGALVELDRMNFRGEKTGLNMQQLMNLL